jgi:hypothetical protein
LRRAGRPLVRGTPTTVPTTIGASTTTGPTCADPWTWSSRRTRRRRRPRRGVPGADGHLAVVVIDRERGATWTAGDAQRPGRTASTIKLAIAADLLARDRSGSIALSGGDHHDIATMLNSADEAASDRLWRAYGGDGTLDRFRTDYGMPTLAFVPGFTRGTPWGLLTTSTTDLAAPTRHVLDGSYSGADARDRTQLVAAMRGGAASTGVCGPPARAAPRREGRVVVRVGRLRQPLGDRPGRVRRTAERFVVAVDEQLDPAGTLADGVHTGSDAVALLSAGPVPAPVVVRAPDG